MLKYYHKLNKIAIHSKKDFIFIFQASLICFRSRGKIYDSSFSGFKIAMAVCKAIGPDESVVDGSYCDPDNRPEKTLMPCNTHPCTAKWVLSWRLACVHASKTLDREFSYRSYVIFSSTKEHEELSVLTNCSPIFTRVVDHVFRYKKVVPSESWSSGCLDFYSFLFTVIVEKKNRSDIFSFERLMPFDGHDLKRWWFNLLWLLS